MSVLKIRSHAHSDIGKVRPENEDRAIHDPETGLFGIADGIGGLPAGAEAAQCAADTVLRLYRGLDPSQGPNLGAIVSEANKAVYSLGRMLSPTTGIGTTLTLGCIRDGKLHLAHVGDSRCYAWSKGELVRLTEDHSVENDAKRRRAQGETVQYHPSHRAALTRCIGQPPPLLIDISERTLLPGDRFLFCTDGVTRMVADHELAELLAANEPPQKTIHDIVALAVNRGGPDNATGVVVAVDAAAGP